MSDKDKYDELSPQADHWKRKADEFYKQWQMTEAKLAQAHDEIERLNKWADGMTDAMLKERRLADATIKVGIDDRAVLREQLAEAREEINRLREGILNESWLAANREGK